MAPVKKGNRVKVLYTGKFNDGTVFETNIGKAPLEFSVGKGKVIKGFETGVLGMSVGQTRTVKMKPAEAYGPKDDSLVWTGEAGELPADLKPALEQEVAFRLADGTMVEGRITAMAEGRITVDGNHPLAGRSLTFEIKLVGIG